jgi:spore germination cell wall hydrolase CwlJ-like protein
MPSASRLRIAILVVTVMVLCSQLIGVNGANASEAIQSDEHRIGQALTRIQQIAQTYASNSHSERSVSKHLQNELRCLALNIYFEARSEPESGQRAVGHVVINRVAHPRYPDSVCEVVQQGGEQVLHRCQFSWWCDGQSDRPMNQQAWAKSLRLAWKVYFGILEDTTGGALWYHATYVKPYWSDSLLKGDRIGQHVFYLENRKPGETL